MKIISLRLDDALHEQLQRLAEEQDRSINKLITHLIKQAVKQADTTSKPATKKEQPR